MASVYRQKWGLSQFMCSVQSLKGTKDAGWALRLLAWPSHGNIFRRFGDCGSADISLGGSAGLFFLTLSSFPIHSPYGTSNSCTGAEKLVWDRSEGSSSLSWHHFQEKCLWTMTWMKKLKTSLSIFVRGSVTVTSKCVLTCSAVMWGFCTAVELVVFIHSVWITYSFTWIRKYMLNITHDMTIWYLLMLYLPAKTSFRRTDVKWNALRKTEASIC